MTNQITIDGRLASDPSVRTVGSSTKCEARIAHQARTKRSGEWVDDGEPLWFTVELWDDAAEIAGNEFRQGDLVEARGEYHERTYDAGSGPRTVREIRRATLALVKRKGGARVATQARTDDPWASGPTLTDEPPF